MIGYGSVMVRSSGVAGPSASPAYNLREYCFFMSVVDGLVVRTSVSWLELSSRLERSSTIRDCFHNSFYDFISIIIVE